MMLATNSLEKVARERKEKVASMNWGKLNRAEKRGNSKKWRDGRGAKGDASAEGVEAARKSITLPKKGDELQCRHFSSCSGCEFDRGFDESPVMVDSR